MKILRKVHGEAKKRLRPLKAPRLKRHHFHRDSTTHKSCDKMNLRRAVPSGQFVIISWCIRRSFLTHANIFRTGPCLYFKLGPSVQTQQFWMSVIPTPIPIPMLPSQSSEEITNTDRQHGSSGETKKRSWGRWNVDLNMKI